MLKKFKDILISQKQNLLKTIDLNEQKNGDKIEFKNIITIIDNISDYTKLYGSVVEKNSLPNNFVAKKILTEYGNIGIVCENNNILCVLQSTLMALKENNNVFINIPDYKNYGLLTIIIEFLNKACEFSNNNLSINLSMSSNNEFVQNIASLDKLIVISNRKYFNKIAPSILVPYTYYPFGKINVLIETPLFADLYKQLPIKNCNFYSTLNIKSIDYFKTDSIQDALYLIESSETQYMTILFTDKKDNGLKFLNNCKSDYVLLNSMPNNKLPNINQNDFLHAKVLVFNEQK